MVERVLAVDDLHVVLGGHPVLSGVSLNVAKGSFTAIVGPNGSGKTTLLRAIYRAVPRTRGSIAVLGSPIDTLSRAQLGRAIGVLRQEPPLSFDFLVEELVLMGRSPHKKLLDPDTATDREIVRESLALTDVAHLASRSFSTLSGGEKQRVLLARALAQRPALLLLDEPTNHLDVKHQLEVLACVRRLGITTVAALHDLNLLFAFATDALLLHRGRALAGGSPDAVLSPEHIREAFGVDAEVLTTADARTVLAFRMFQA
jgi:iron complex transport system ATP-binding protein